MPRSTPPSACCSTPSCCSAPDTTRRAFLAAAGAAGAGAASALAAGMPVMAGPFPVAAAPGAPAAPLNPPHLDPAHIVPLDKKLSPQWLASLTARGEPEVYANDDARFIGMPVGGIFAGTLYLSGDGRLWIWNIFNRDVNGVLPRDVPFEGRKVNAQNGANYVAPSEFLSPVEQGFTLTTRAGDKSVTKKLQRGEIKDITFKGQYPIGTVTYRDPEVPVSVQLEAFSPFIPLDPDDSGLPATILHFTLTNTTQAPVEATLTGLLENAVLMHHRDLPGAARRNQVVADKGMTFLSMSAVPPAGGDVKPKRPDALFEDWNKETYEGWTVEGTAFGPGPTLRKEIPSYQGDVGGEGPRVVNSHNARAAKDVRGGDGHVGKLTSKPFTIDRPYINLWVGGGNHKGKTCVNVVVGGKPVRSITGKADNRMSLESIDVRDLAGKEARLEIVDNEKGPWGNIGVGTIRFSDAPAQAVSFDKLHDLGTMGLALLGDKAETATASYYNTEPEVPADTRVPASEKLVGSLARTLKLAPGASASATFFVTWHFPNLALSKWKDAGRHYASRFDSARAVARYVADHFDRLANTTRLWRDTWYDSTLPYWFLNRTFANTSTLATTTCYRFKDGRFWAWEGIGCCPGTCTHVWHYAQAMGRIFPQVERDQRRRVDLDIALDPRTGAMRFRAENNNGPAIDGQAGTILRVYREHRMSSDDAFLKQVWPAAKKAIQYLVDRDADADGLIEGPQHNTLDADWFGKVPWLCGLYHAALRAGEEMAREAGDEAFAATCRAIFEKGIKSLDQCWSDRHGYYVQIPDPRNANAIAIHDGCEIDQVFGQSWAHQVGLGRVMNEDRVRRQLRALWDYNFIPDIGPLRASLDVKVRGRPYAVAGDAGLLMCTWPFGGRNPDWQKHWQYGYFNECMSGFEWQVAGHMIWEGMLTEGLAIARAIHDRYNGRLRNPYNEVECSDHYARAMASYGAFLAACGYEYHGPKGHLAFAPRLAPENFRAPFTAAEGWGTYAQQLTDAGQRCELIVKHGKLRLAQLRLTYAGKQAPTKATLTVPGGEMNVATAVQGQAVTLTFTPALTLAAGQSATVVVS